jgi:hypothetical protein
MIFRHFTSAVQPPPRARNGLRLLVVTALLGVLAGCDGASSSAPTAVPVRLSGHVYQRPTAELGEPLLSDVLITIEQTDGSHRTTRTNAAGFYTVSVSRGLISISAGKAGYQTNRSQFELSSDTVLNFSLVPDAS